MTEETQTFNIGFHRYVAQQIESGRATTGLIEGSHEQLLAEVERLTKLVFPEPAKPQTVTAPVAVDTLVGLMDVLAKHVPTAEVQVEHMGTKSSPGYMGSYRGYYDQLAIRPDGQNPMTVADVVKKLRTIFRKGIPGEGGPYEVRTFTGVWVDRGQAEGQHLTAVRTEDGIVILMTESRDW
jgi:hypothetical protein